MRFNVEIGEDVRRYNVTNSGDVGLVADKADEIGLHVTISKDKTLVCHNIPKVVQETLGMMHGYYISNLFADNGSSDVTSAIKMVNTVANDKAKESSCLVIINSVETNSDSVHTLELLDVAHDVLEHYITDRYRDYRNLMVYYSLSEVDYDKIKSMQIQCVRCIFDDVTHSILIH